MPSRALLPWSEELLRYDFGGHHPMTPRRLALTYDLMTALGVTAAMTITDVPLAAEDDLERVHTPDYIAAVKRARPGSSEPRYGLGDPDTPAFPDMHEASARIVGATLHTARAVWHGEAPRAWSLAGGMHHAMPARAGGFCVYNDVAVAIAALLAEGATRVAYVDVDAHHGDGVERAFWDDDRVLTISIHQHPDTLYPGTGYVQDGGGPAARGYAVNAPVPPGTTDDEWLRVVDAIVGPLVQEFRPEVLITQHGCDTHPRDPLARLAVSVDAQREVAQMCGEYAQRFAQGRWVATGGGGYDVSDVVPRVWSHVAAIVAGRPIDVATALPREWREHAGVAEAGATTMGDGRTPQLRSLSEGFDPSDDVDRVIMAVRRAVFPWHGLDPMPH